MCTGKEKDYEVIVNCQKICNFLNCLYALIKSLGTQQLWKDEAIWGTRKNTLFINLHLMKSHILNARHE